MKIHEAVPKVPEVAAQPARVVLGKGELKKLEAARDVLAEFPHGLLDEGLFQLTEFIKDHNLNGFVSVSEPL